MEKQKKINGELTKLNELLRDSSFTVDVARTQDSMYHRSQGNAAPSFDVDKDSMFKKSFKEEKIAVNLAPFYAVECGVGALVDQKSQTPVYWLKKITDKNLDSSEMLLLNRFANATWKAGQPFRSMSRIERENFIVANFLNAEETRKDFDQVHAAASKLLDSLTAYADQPKEEQFKRIAQLMKDKNYALEMAQYVESAFYTAQKKDAPPFLESQQDTNRVDKNKMDEKVATNAAAFYALECGLSYLASAEKKVPSDVLQSIVNDSIDTKDKVLLERFANATWKAGQPFRGLDRISRDVFIPFYFLSKEEIEKDWVQIKSVAGKLIREF